MPVVRTDGRSLGHVITKFSGMGRFIYPWCPAGALRARSSANNFFVWLVVTSLIRNRSPRLSFLHDPQCVPFVFRCCRIVQWCTKWTCIVTRQGKQSLNLASAIECFLSTRLISFPFVESWLKHSYFFANTFSLSALKAAKNALQPFWIQTGWRKRLNLFAFHSNNRESFQEWTCVMRSSGKSTDQ